MRKVSAGQPLRIPAADYNVFVDAALDYQRRTRDLGGAAVPPDTKSGIVIVRNQSGADQDQFAILAVDGVVFTPTDNEREFKTRTAFDVVTPTEDGDAKFVVLQEPIRSGGLGKAVLLGVSPVLVDVSDEDHGYADVEADQTAHLKSAAAGAARILWKEDGTGELWAVALFPVAPARTAIRLDGEPLTQADDGTTPEPHEVAVNEALRIVQVGEVYRLALNLNTLYVFDPVTGRKAPLSAVLRLPADNVLAIRKDAKFSDGVLYAELATKYCADTSKYHADGAFPAEDE